MKKILAIFFCLQIFSSNAFVAEVMKIPLLMQHYFEHSKQEHPNLNFSDFIWEHYVASNHQDEADGHCAEKIPFKHCSDCCHHDAPTSNFISSVSFFQFLQAPLLELVKADQNLFISSNYLANIWQPPKLS